MGMGQASGINRDDDTWYPHRACQFLNL